MRRMLLAFIFFTLGAHWTFSQQMVHESVIWNSYTALYQVKEGLTAHVNVQYRYFLDRDHFYHLYFAGAVTRDVGKGFAIGGGFINLNVNRYIDTGHVLVPEIRPFQGISYRTAVKKASFDWRFLVEERFFRNAANGELVAGSMFNFRYRNRLRLKFPLTKKWKLSVSSETFINSGRTGLNTFDQHRGIIETHYSFGSVKLSTGYQSWVVLSGSGQLQNRHTWLIRAIHVIGSRG